MSDLRSRCFNRIRPKNLWFICYVCIGDCSSDNAPARQAGAPKARPVLVYGLRNVGLFLSPKRVDCFALLRFQTHLGGLGNQHRPNSWAAKNLALHNIGLRVLGRRHCGLRSKMLALPQLNAQKVGDSGHDMARGRRALC